MGFSVCSPVAPVACLLTLFVKLAGKKCHLYVSFTLTVARLSVFLSGVG